jgi:hypothetical protein
MPWCFFVFVSSSSPAGGSPVRGIVGGTVTSPAIELPAADRDIPTQSGRRQAAGVPAGSRCPHPGQGRPADWRLGMTVRGPLRVSARRWGWARPTPCSPRRARQAPVAARRPTAPSVPGNKGDMIAAHGVRWLPAKSSGSAKPHRPQRKRRGLHAGLSHVGIVSPRARVSASGCEPRPRDNARCLNGFARPVGTGRPGNGLLCAKPAGAAELHGLVRPGEPLLMWW